MTIFIIFQNVIKGIIAGMCYLERHYDLRAQNVYLTENFDAKVSISKTVYNLWKV